MGQWKNMPVSGAAVIILTLLLFAAAVTALLLLCLRYRRLRELVSEGEEGEDAFLRFVVDDFTDAYRQYGQDVNTPAIISNAVQGKLGRCLLGERFLNNAVSLFVTLGLFGTFLGLSHSVSSLTELIGYSDTSEWLSVLDSVGGGLMSALSGMGVAFYTSLVGVACSILLTLLRSILNPQARREQLETQLELWLDHSLAPTLAVTAARDDAALARQLLEELRRTGESVDASLRRATGDLGSCIESSRAPLEEFQRTVQDFNEGVRDFSEFNYNLRGTVERMDVSLRDVVGALRGAGRKEERGGRG